jgi:hypothetical protein
MLSNAFLYPSFAMFKRLPGIGVVHTTVRAFTLRGFCTFAQFAEPMTASLADRRELARPPSAFAAFQGHFLSAFAAFRPGICAIDFSSLKS